MIRILMGFLFVGALAAAFGVGYTKGQASVFKGILSGTATFQKEQQQLAKEDQQQAVEDATKLTQLKQERDHLQKQLAQQKRSAPVSPDACIPVRDTISRMREAARKANED